MKLFRISGVNYGNYNVAYDNRDGGNTAYQYYGDDFPISIVGQLQLAGKEVDFTFSLFQMFEEDLKMCNRVGQKQPASRELIKTPPPPLQGQPALKSIQLLQSHCSSKNKKPCIEDNA